MKTLMIYGATGYTGRMAAEQAKALGIPLVLAGRSADPLLRLAHELNVDSRIFAIEDALAVDDALRGADALLNCAGPFLRTAEPLMQAAIRARIHYLDFAAELTSYRLAEALDSEAKAAGSMLLPGCGGSVAMLGSLAGHAATRVSGAHTVAIALHVSGGMSRGSAISATTNVTTECLAMLEGSLAPSNPELLRDFDFGHGPVACFPVTLPDLITIHRATGAANVATFVHVSGDAFPKGDVTALPDGPSLEQRRANRYQAAVEVLGANGSRAKAVLDTVNGYTFTALASAEAARRVLAGEFRAGFQTPAGLFGNRFAETIADTVITDTL